MELCDDKKLLQKTGRFLSKFISERGGSSGVRTLRRGGPHSSSDGHKQDFKLHFCLPGEPGRADSLLKTVFQP